jgi:hypothetical protein
MTARELIEDFGGRRFLLCLMVGVSATMLQAYGKLDAPGNTYMMVMLGVIGVYVTGNTTQKIKGTADVSADGPGK